MSITSTRAGQASAALAPTSAWDTSAPFTKRWGMFSAYSFLDGAWENVIGYLGQEGREGHATTLDLNPWVDQASLASQLIVAEQRMARGLPYNIRFTVRALGHTVTLQESGFLMEEQLAEGALIKGFLQDITAQRASEEEANRQRIFYEGTLNKMPVELVVLDKNQRYIFCNKTAIKNDDLRAWLIGKTDLDYCLHRGKDPKTVELRQNYFNQAVSTKSEIEWEEIQKNEHGESDYNLKRYSPILDQDGEIVIVIGYGFNISDRRRAEIRAKQSDELIRSLAENVQEGIFRLSRQGDLLFANDAFYNLFPADLAAKMRSGSIDEQSDKLIQLFLGSEADQEDAGETQHRAGREVSFSRDGIQQTWLVSVRKSVDGEHVDGVVVDITSLKEAQEDLEQKNIELEKAYMELDRFVYSASHDLRAPLTSVLGLVKVMEGEHEQGEDMTNALPYIGMIKSSVERLDGFVKEIIQYYRNNRTDLQVRRMDVGELVQGVYASLEHLRPDMRLTFEASDETGQQLELDAPRLTIVLNNLISNAIKYHNKIQGRIQTRARISEGSLLITVADDGPGILPEHHSKLFDMFYRVGFDNSGSGLGLYIVHETVKKMGGSIAFESTPAQGSAFTVAIPLEAN